MSNLAERIEDLAPGIYRDLPSAQYHALPYVSSSFLKRFRRNPASALLPVEQTLAMVLGSASHAYSLEGDRAFLDGYAVLPAGIDRRTKAGKEEWAMFEAANQGKTLLTRDQADAVLGIDNSLKTHPLASMLLKRGTPELSLVWDDAETGLRCKARIDLDPHRLALIDYKTCADVGKFDRQMVGLNYDIQAAAYSMGATACGIDHDVFIFVAAETSEPYPVRCGYLAPEWLEWAKGETRRLLRLVAECRESDHYPNYEIPVNCESLADLKPYDLLEAWEMPKWR